MYLNIHVTLFFYYIYALCFDPLKLKMHRTVNSTQWESTSFLSPDFSATFVVSYYKKDGCSWFEIFLWC